VLINCLRASPLIPLACVLQSFIPAETRRGNKAQPPHRSGGLLCYPVREELLLGVVAHIGKREHRNRWLIG
jgi:hypothetical protein